MSKKRPDFAKGDPDGAGLRRAVMHTMAMTTTAKIVEMGNAIRMGEKLKDSQRTKANRPRGKGDDGRTMRDLIGSATEWTHLQSAIVEWSGGECKLLEGPTRYQYTARNGKLRTITLRHFRAVRRKVRAARDTP